MTIDSIGMGVRMHPCFAVDAYICYALKAAPLLFAVLDFYC